MFGGGGPQPSKKNDVINYKTLKLYFINATAWMLIMIATTVLFLSLSELSALS